MDRKEFLTAVGLGMGSFALMCAGCSKSVASGTAAPSGVDFTIDLSQVANAALQTNGGYVYNSGVIVARTLAGSYIAVQQSCTHENFSIVYQGSRQRFYCDGHGATFSESGTVEGGPAPRSLQTYKTSLNGTLLRVYS